MTEERVLPTSGYEIEKIYTHKLLLTVRRAQEGETGGVLFKWDWRFLSGGVFEVSLGVKIEPSPARSEEVEAVFLGRFRPKGDVQSVTLVDFAEQHAPGILMPYARHAIAMMTSWGFFGVLNVHPMNMRAVVADLNVEPTGRKQLAEVHPAPLRGALPAGTTAVPVKAGRRKRTKPKPKESAR